MSFIYKYRPKNLDEYLNQENAVKKLKEYVFNFRDKFQGKALFFWGPPGTGKSSLVYAFANTYNLELIEINASDDRNAKNLEELFKHASSTKSLFKKGKIFLFDEVDGISPIDRGAINALIKIIKESKYPIILIANDPWDSKLKTLRQYSIMVEFKKLSTTLIYSYLKKIAILEKIKYEDLALKQLAAESNGDLRAALNDLESLSKVGVNSETIKQLGYREIEINVFETLARIFKSEKISVAALAVNESDTDPDILINWIEENIPKEYEKKEEIFRAYMALSKADIYRARIIRRQEWAFLAYYTFMMSAGVALAKDKKYRKFTKYSRPLLYLKLNEIRNKKEAIKNIIKDINENYKVSKREYESFIIPLIKSLSLKDKEKAKKLALSFGIREEFFEIIVK